MKKISKSALISIVFGSLILSSVIFNNEKTVEKKIFSELINDINNKKINRVEFYEEYVFVYDKKNRPYKVLVDPNSKALLSNNIPNNIQVEYFNTPFWILFFRNNLISFLLLLLFFFSFMFGGLPGIKTGRNKFKLTLNQKTLFSDIAGAEEAKEELKEVIEFLKNPKKFADIGAKIPKGILLCGAPGTGKTLLAKAVSCEAGCSFYYASGSEFEEIYVGVGASRMRSLFEEAKKNSPSIIFIDEIDTIGGRRNKFSSVGDQTLNELLTQLDGFETNQSVILFAATNRPESLDSALLRPGRIGDRIIKVDLPYLKQREDILSVHLKKVKFDPTIFSDFSNENNQKVDIYIQSKESTQDSSTDDIENEDYQKINSNIQEKESFQDNEMGKIEDDAENKPKKEEITIENESLESTKISKKETLSVIAKITAGFSGADLANVVNEAALLAAKNNEKMITLKHLKTSVEKVSMGSEKKNIHITEQDKLRTAYHESGHAIVAKIFDKNKSIHIITILPRGFALGYVYRTNENDSDKVSESKAEILNDIKICFGGYVAEQIFFGEDGITSGPRNDLEQANKRAKDLVSEFGMSKIGFMNYNAENKQISQLSLSKAEEEINNILNQAYNEVSEILNKNKNILENLAKLLLEKEVLYSADIEIFFEKNIFSMN